MNGRDSGRDQSGRGQSYAMLSDFISSWGGAMAQVEVRCGLPLGQATSPSRFPPCAPTAQSEAIA